MDIFCGSRFNNEKAPHWCWSDRWYNRGPAQAWTLPAIGTILATSHILPLANPLGQFSLLCTNHPPSNPWESRWVRLSSRVPTTVLQADWGLLGASQETQTRPTTRSPALRLLRILLPWYHLTLIGRKPANFWQDEESEFSSEGTDLTSLSSSILEYEYENGRRYHSNRIVCRIPSRPVSRHSSN
jgi:hypothetical protein